MNSALFPSDETKIFGILLSECRATTNLSQNCVSSIAKYDHRSLQRVEKGIQIHGVINAAKLVADAAHLTKNLRPSAHSDKKADENKCEETAEEQTNDDSNFHFKHMNADSDIADLSVDIDEDLSEGVSDLYAMDGVSEEDTAVDTKPLHEDDVNPEEKKEDTVNSSIHL